MGSGRVPLDAAQARRTILRIAEDFRWAVASSSWEGSLFLSYVHNPATCSSSVHCCGRRRRGQPTGVHPVGSLQPAACNPSGGPGSQDRAKLGWPGSGIARGSTGQANFPGERNAL